MTETATKSPHSIPREGQNSISASIVLYNNECGMVRQVIKCVLDSGIISDFHIIDNSPSDSLRKECADERCKYQHLGKNIGFGPGHNIAIRASVSEFHVVINPDIYFEKSSLDCMLQFMKTHPDVGLLSPKVCFPDGSTQYLCRRYPSVFSLSVRRFMPFFLKKHFQSTLDYSEMRDTGYNRQMDIEFASGCFMFFRRSFLLSVNGFDERFFLYFEDMDLSYRLSMISRVVFNPETVVFHHWQRGSYKSLKLMFYNILSSIRFFNKHGWKFI